MLQDQVIQKTALLIGRVLPWGQLPGGLAIYGPGQRVEIVRPTWAASQNHPLEPGLQV